MHPRALLEQFGYRPKKRLGQNFLIDAGAAKRIASLVCDDSRPVLEIGPGTGALTLALLQCCPHVTAIDVDPQMIRVLRAQNDLRSATIIEADALTFDYEAFADARPWRMTGNLPYNIATPLVMRLIEMRNGPELLAVMVQKEVADRFGALPGTRAYGSLSVAVQYAMTVEHAFTLSPAAFYPRPKVDSAVVVLRRRGEPAVQTADAHRYLQVVRAAFAYRRKTLANSVSLALGLQRADVARELQDLGLDTEIRGEQLGLEDFARLADRLSV